VFVDPVLAWYPITTELLPPDAADALYPITAEFAAATDALYPNAIEVLAVQDPPGPMVMHPETVELAEFPILIAFDPLRVDAPLP
jgi:hypothetical protein